MIVHFRFVRPARRCFFPNAMRHSAACCAPPLGISAKFNDKVSGRFGIEEYDAAVACPIVGFSVSKPTPLPRSWSWRRFYVFHLQADVEQTFSVLGDPLAGAGARLAGLQLGFSYRLPDRKHGEAGAMRWQMLLIFHLDAELSKMSRIGPDALHGDGDVFDAFDLHEGLPEFCSETLWALGQSKPKLGILGRQMDRTKCGVCLTRKARLLSIPGPSGWLYGEARVRRRRMESQGDGDGDQDRKPMSRYRTRRSFQRCRRRNREKGRDSSRPPRIRSP